MKPQINIKYGKLLDPFFRDHVLVKYPTYEFPSEDKVLEKVKLFKEAWLKFEDIFINSIYEITKLSFKRNVIDCFIVSATPRDMSAPLVIRSRYTEDEFVDVLLHELLHVFLSENGVKRFKYSNEESERTLNHITVFALLMYFYTNILNDDERLSAVKLKSTVGNNKEYARAWEIVEEVGYMKIIQDIETL